VEEDRGESRAAARRAACACTEIASVRRVKHRMRQHDCERKEH
jgi:hypothetical protein